MRNIQEEAARIIKQEEDNADMDEDVSLLTKGQQDNPIAEFQRQRNIAQQCCETGRRLLAEGKWEEASKEFSKAVMTFEYILKHNIKQQQLKHDISDMMKQTIRPAYSNLALCNLKLQRYGMVITFADQVLATDSANVKNVYRRGVARKMTKMYDEAIADFEKVITLDQEMKTECKNLINDCKLQKKQQKKREKELAKQFMQGYSETKPSPVPQNAPIPIQQKAPSGLKLTLWQRGLNLLKGIKDYCPRLFKRS